MRMRNVLCILAGLLFAGGSFAQNNSIPTPAKGNAVAMASVVPMAMCAGKIGDFIWNDLNGNGIQDAGEPGINGVTVRLYDSNNNLRDTQVTAAGPTGGQLGYYQFTACPGVTYTVQVDETTLPKGSDGKIHFELTAWGAPSSTPATDSNTNPATVTLTGTSPVDQTIDFGYVSMQGAIGDYVWYDANRNGIQDAGENGINGVVVNLYDSTGKNLLATTITAMGGHPNANGYYQFTGLDEGTYTVIVDSSTLPPNYVPTTPLLGGDTTLDSNGSPATVSLPKDSSVDETIDFGYATACTGTIGDFVWHDLNRNGLQDDGEPGISGVTLNLFDSAHALIQTTATDASGKYVFSGLCEGTFDVEVKDSTLPPQFTPTFSVSNNPVIDSNGSPAPVTLTIGGNNTVTSDLTIDFGYISPCDGAIGDFVWNDLNSDGIQNQGEPGMNQVPVNLFDVNHTLLNSTTTFNNGITDGYYQFTGLCAGTYSVEVVPPAWYLPATVNAPGSTPANDSNPSPSTVVLSVINDNGDVTNDETIDFGFVLPVVSSTCVVINAVQGNAITPVTMVGSGGAGGPYTFTATGLPAGLTMSSDGTISGIPTVSGTFSYTVTVTDSNGNTGSVNCSVTVAPPVSATCVVINAVQGIAITPVTMIGSGGMGGPYTFTAMGLPDGLSMSLNGTISGIPTVSGTFNYTVTVTDSAGNTGTVDCSLTVNPLPSATCVAINAVQGVAITPLTMLGSGGLGGPYTFIATGLPAGLTMASDGTISGTPTVSGTFSYTVTVKDSAGNTGTVNCSVTVAPPVSATCVAINAVQGIAIAPVAILGSGGSGGPYTFTAIGLPAGLTMASDGTISGTPTVSGTFGYTVTVTDSKGNTGTVNCSVTVAPPGSASCVVINAVQGLAITPVTMVGSGGSGGPYTFTATGLPAGLTMSSNGTISGIPTVSGTFSYTVTVKDSAGNTSTVNCSVTVAPPVSASCVVISAVQGLAITPVTMLGSGGSGGPYTFTATGLPPGLTMSSNGTISGTPTVSGTFNYAVTVKDSAGNWSVVNCSVTVAPPVSASCVVINAVQGVPITPVAMLGTGGSGGPYTFTATGLPAGLTMSSNGAISGTPTVSGTFNYTVTLTDGKGDTGTVNCSVAVAPPISASCVAIDAVQGNAITPVTLVANGGTGPYTFTAAGLPTGLTISASGTISGTPTVSGTFNYTVTITDSKGRQGTVSCKIVVAPPVSTSCVSFSAIQGVAITPVALVGNGGSGGQYTFTATGLPPGLTMSSSGVISGTPTASGTYTYTVTIHDAGGYQGSGRCSHNGTLKCTIVVAPPVSASCVAIDAVQGNAITPVTLVANGGTGPYTFTAAGLPTGLTISASGTISGTPTVSGTFNYTVTITDSKGRQGTVSCKIVVAPPVSTSCVSFSAIQGVAITPVALVGNGGSGGQYTFTATGLPPGLTMSSSGVISGTPTASGTYTYTVTIHDAGGYQGSGRCSHNGTLKCTIVVAPPVSASCVSINAFKGVAITPVTLVGSGGLGGPYTFSATGLPAGLTMSSSGTISGTPTVSGTFNYTLTIKDKAGNKGTVSCSVAVTPQLSLCGGDTATIGFWHNNNGQALIVGVNGGPSATKLATWLATNFPYLYGAKSGSDLTGKTNADVAALFMRFFGVTGAKTNAQILGGALAAYVTNSNLAGSSSAAAYGFNVSPGGTGTKSYNVGSYGTAIGLSNNAAYTVMQLLQQANMEQQLGAFNATAFNAIFDGINSNGDIN